MARFFRRKDRPPLSKAGLARDNGVAVTTVPGWISVPDAPFVVCLPKPPFKSARKPLVRSPKGHFIDTGPWSFLTGLTTEKLVAGGPLADLSWRTTFLPRSSNAGLTRPSDPISWGVCGQVEVGQSGTC